MIVFSYKILLAFSLYDLRCIILTIRKQIIAFKKGTFAPPAPPTERQEGRLLPPAPLSGVPGSIDRVHTEPGKPGKYAIFTKNLGKHGRVRGFSIIFVKVWEKSGKTDYLVSIQISLTIGMVVCKVVALMIVNICELYHLAS